MGEEDSDIEILENESYSGGKEKGFSHQELVMIALRRALIAGNKEMRPGYYNTKTDARGNTSMVYVDDTRKQFIESVKSVGDMISCDLDELANKKIIKLKEELKEKFLKLCAEEKLDWETAHPKTKNQRWKEGVFHRPERLHPQLPYAQEYVEEEVDAYRKILREYVKLTKRKDFYKEEMYEA